MRLDCYSYQLPFHKPLKSSRKVYRHREGLIFRLSGSMPASGSLFHCYGEAAPLPGFSPETVQDTLAQTENHIDDWAERLKTDKSIERLQAHFHAEKIYPSLQFALDALAYQYEARRTGKTLASLLLQDAAAGAYEEGAAAGLAVNGLMSLVEFDENPLSSVRELAARGFRTIKCKVGFHFQRERELLIQIRKSFPDLRIRLDANRGWSLDEAIAHLNALESIGIEYCEEPLRQPDRDTYRQLRLQTNIPLALDESIIKNRDWERLLPFCSVLVIKPMVIGSFTKLLAIREQAKKQGCSLVFTSSLESGVGRTITAALALALGSARHAHGLNSGTLLARDILPRQRGMDTGFIHPPMLDALTIDKKDLETLATPVISSL